jgi:hypothetical protein
MAIAGHTTRIKVSGVAVAVTAEATTSLGGGVYQVTSTSRRIWDPSAAITVKDGGVAVSAANYTFDYLFGKVTFSVLPAGAVTVDGSYLPVATLAEVKSFNFSGAADLLDTTTFDSAGSKTKTKGLKDASGSLTMLSTPLDDIDPVTGGVQTLNDVFTGGTVKVLEALLGTVYLRAFVVFESLEESAAVDGLVETTANFQTSPQALGAAFSIDT